MRIGSLNLESNLFLAPLAGYTNLPFRLLVRELGGVGLATTDLVSARSLLERRPKALKLIQSRPADRPLAVQLFGAVPEEMRDAALYVESLGVSVIDINMGCPVRKVCRVGGGSAMLAEMPKTCRLVEQMVQAVRIPVTAKMRLGWDESNLTAPDLARALEDVGLAAVTVHGRTREQGFSGAVNLAGIGLVVAAVRAMPVIGNGDVVTPQAAKMMLEQTGCAAVSIGRGAFYNPWIFSQTRHYLATGQGLPEPTLSERLAVMSRHLDWMIEVFGETLACRMFRKVAPFYSKRFGPASEFNRRVVRCSSRAEYDEAVAAYLTWRRQFLDEDGQLQARFQPPPMVASFMPNPQSARPATGAGQIPVPPGPVERW